MKKFYYLFVLLLGLTTMTSCEEEVPMTDTERFVGTWLYEDPSASDSYDLKQVKFVFNSNSKGSYTFTYGDNTRTSYKINQWWVDEEDMFVEFVDEDGDRYKLDYEFDEDILLLDMLNDGTMCVFERI